MQWNLLAILSILNFYSFEDAQQRKGIRVPSVNSLWWGRAVITGWYVMAIIHLWPPSSVVHGTTIIGYRLWAFQHLAYSDIFALYKNHRLYMRHLPYLRTPIEYPVLMGLTMWGVSLVTLSAKQFFVVTAVLLWIAALTSYHYIHRLSPALAPAFALSPLLLVYGLLNWDMIGICLMLMALDTFRRQCFRLSAILWAIAVFFKFFPIFFLPYLATTLWQRGQWRTLRHMLAWFTIAAAIINVPFALTNWDNWSLFFTFNASRAVSADVWNNGLVHLSSIRLIDLISLVVVLVTVAVAGRASLRSLSLEEAAAISFGVFLFVNKVFSPQYMLWLATFGIVAEWPNWTFATLALAGTIDYVNSVAIMYLTLVPADGGAAQWYGATLYQIGLFARYAAIAATTGLAPVKSWFLRSTRRISSAPLSPRKYP